MKGQGRLLLCLELFDEFFQSLDYGWQAALSHCTGVGCKSARGMEDWVQFEAVSSGHLTKEPSGLMSQEDFF